MEASPASRGMSCLLFAGGCPGLPGCKRIPRQGASVWEAGIAGKLLARMRVPKASAVYSRLP